MEAEDMWGDHLGNIYNGSCPLFQLQDWGGKFKEFKQVSFPSLSFQQELKAGKIAVAAALRLSIKFQ